MTFSITGEFITEHFRQLCLEGHWSEALNSIQDSLIGFSVENAIAVLSGEKNLVGENKLSLEENKDTSYKEEFLSLYKNLLYRGTELWEVVYKMNTINPKDKHILERIAMCAVSPKAEASWDYIFHNKTCLIIRKSTKTPPFWLIKEIGLRKIDLSSIEEIGFIPPRNDERSERRKLFDIASFTLGTSDFQEEAFFDEELSAREEKRAEWERDYLKE